MAVEPVEFLVDVELLRDQGQLDFETCRVGFDVQLFESLALFGTRVFQDFRHTLAYRCRDGLDVGTARFEHVGDPLTLARAHRRDRVEGLVEQSASFGE